LARDLLEAHPARVGRYALAAAHYRANLDVSDPAIAEAAAALERIDGFAQRAQRAQRAVGSAPPNIPDAFRDAMD
ncbi:MAG: cysteine--tRNA ligase, partial [Microbacterium gubbeenense]